MSPDPMHPNPERLLREMGWIRGLARGLVADPNVADDLTQETWLSASRSAELTRGGIVHVLRNRLRSRLLSERRRAAREERAARPEAVPSSEDLSARMETQRLLAEAVLRLEEPYRSTVILRYSEDLAPTEIARRLGVPPGTVRSRLKRALDKLRADLDARFDGGREAWSMAVAPWVVGGASTLSPVAPVMLVGGTIALKKILVAVVVAVALGGWWLVDMRAGPSPTEAASASTPLDGPDLPGHGSGLAAVEAAKTGREPVPGVPSSGNAPSHPVFSSAPGWWLVGQVHGVSPVSPGITTLDVSLPNHRMGPLVEGIASAEGAVELDLTPIFEDPHAVPRALEVLVRRDGFVPETLAVEIDRERRQAGFVPGGRAEIGIDVTLQRAAATVRGAVIVPDGCRLDEVAAALVPLGEANPDLVPTDVVQCGPDATFQLTGDGLGPHAVVAFLDVRGRPRLLHPCVRPATTTVTLGEETEELQDPLVLTDGSAIEGVVRGAPGVQVAVIARRADAERIPALGNLCWMGGSFELFDARTLSDDTGVFRLAGLAPHEYEVSWGGFGWAGRSLSYASTRGGGGAGWDEPLRVHAPAVGVTIEPGHPVYAFQVVSSGAPLTGATVGEHHEAGWEQFQLGDSSRFVLVRPLDSTKELLFGRPGYEPRTLVLEAGEPPHPEWRPVDLTVGEPWGTLDLRIVGDPDRTVERFSVRIREERYAAGEVRRLPGFKSWAHLKRGRDGEAIRFDDIPPGCYRVEVEPDQHSAEDCYVLPQALDLDLTDGGTQTITVHLEEGGRLSISTGPIERDHLVFRLLDPHGEEVSTELLVRFADGQQTRSFGSLLRRGTSLTQPLPPGTYTVEVRGGGRDSPWRKYPVTLESGETVDLNLDEDQGK